MNKPAGQHLIAKFILKKFADPDGFLHCFHKPSDRIFPARPEQAIRENHLYTLASNDGTQSYVIEEELGKLESAVAPTLQKAIEAARSGRFPALSTKEDEVIRVFLWVQLRRSRMARDVLRASFQLKESETYEDNWRRSLTVPIDAESKAVLFNKGMVFGVIEDAATRALAIGDHALIMGREGHVPISHPNTEISMPVASDVLVSLHGPSRLRALLSLDEITEQVNDGVLAYSDTIATSSLAGTQALRRRWRTTPALAALPRIAGRDTAVQGKT